MKKNITKLISVLCLLLGFTAQSYAQSVGINTTDPKITLDVKTSGAAVAEGLIAPSLTRQQLISKDAAYGNDQVNTLIYVKDLTGTTTTKTQHINTPGYYYFDGTAWEAYSAIEPWYKVGTSLRSTSILDSIYLQGKVVIKGNTVGQVNGAPAALTVYNGDASFNYIRVGRGNFNLPRNTVLGPVAVSTDPVTAANNDLTVIGGVFSYAEYKSVSGVSIGAILNPTFTGRTNSDFVSIVTGLDYLSPYSVNIGSPTTTLNDSCNIMVGHILQNNTRSSVAVGGYQNLNMNRNSVLIGDSIQGNILTDAVYVGPKIITGSANGSTIVGSNIASNTPTYLIVANNGTNLWEASNAIVLGNTSTTTIRAAVTSITTLSDFRVKKNIKSNVPGISFINKLNPVTYKFNIAPTNSTNLADNKRSPENIIHSGFIAQDVEQATKDIKYDFDGISVPENEADRYGLNYSSFVVPLVKAVQEQQSTIKDEQALLSQQKDKLQKQNARLEILSQKLDLLENK